MPFINTGIYNDGDLYHSDAEDLLDFVAEQEAHSHYVSLRLRYSAELIPGASEAFRLLRASLRTAPDIQQIFTHEAFADRVESTEHVAARVNHSGSEFIIKHIQLMVQRKKHQPKG